MAARQPQLPPGWEMLVDHRTNIPYYVDHNTKTTQWQPPSAPMGYHQQAPQQHQPPQQQQLPHDPRAAKIGDVQIATESLYQQVMQLQADVRARAADPEALRKKQLQLNELLVRQQLALDAISCSDAPQIRQARKMAIDRIEKVITFLEGIKTTG